MPLELRELLALALALGVTLVTTPLAARLAAMADFYDRPVGYKAHVAPTPYLGGSAVLAGFLVAVLVTVDLSVYWPLAFGAIGLWGVGTIDDYRNLGVRPRLLATGGAALLLWTTDLGWAVTGVEELDFALTMLWVLALVNAFNLFDNLDGAAGTVAAVVAAGLGLLAAHRGDAALAALCFALIGACAGFLRFNLAAPRARIFLGDGGSMPIGFIVAGAAMSLPPQPSGGLSLAVGAVVLVGLPILDTALVIVSRVRRGVSVMSGGRDHLTHRLLGPLGSPRAVALTLAAAQAVLSALALAALGLGAGWIVGVGIGYGLAALASITSFERGAWAVPDWPSPSPQVGAAAREPAAAPQGVTYQSASADYR